MAQTDKSIAPNKGRMEEMTFYTRKGQTIVRSAHRSKSERERSPIVMNRRARWKNVQNSWSQFGGALKGLFETKKAQQSEYNVYMSENLPTAQVYLNKKECLGAPCVVDHFVVSAGHLSPSIAVTSTEGAHVSSLGIGDLVVNEQTRVNEFVAKLEGMPEDLYEGEYELRFICARQRMAGLDTPRLEVKTWSLMLDYKDRRPLMAALGAEDVGMGLMNVGGFLAARRELGTLVAWVLRHEDEEGHYKVTSQRLVGDNPLLEEYTNGVARFAAVYSYGPVFQPNYFKTGVDLQPGEVMFAPSRRYTEEQMQECVFQVQVEGEVLPAKEAGTIEGTGRYPQGSQVNLRAVAAEGWRFLCWSDGVLTQERQVTPQRDESFSAIFAPGSAE